MLRGRQFSPQIIEIPPPNAGGCVILRVKRWPPCPSPTSHTCATVDKCGFSHYSTNPHSCHLVMYRARRASTGVGQFRKLAGPRTFSSSKAALTADLNTTRPQRTSLTGRALLNAPTFNKGTAFTTEERKTFGLEGLLPSGVHSLEEQVHRAYEQYRSLGSDLLRNSFMTSM